MLWSAEHEARLFRVPRGAGPPPGIRPAVGADLPVRQHLRRPPEVKATAGRGPRGSPPSRSSCEIAAPAGRAGRRVQEPVVITEQEINCVPGQPSRRNRAAAPRPDHHADSREASSRSRGRRASEPAPGARPSPSCSLHVRGPARLPVWVTVQGTILGRARGAGLAAHGRPREVHRTSSASRTGRLGLALILGADRHGSAMPRAGGGGGGGDPAR